MTTDDLTLQPIASASGILKTASMRRPGTFETTLVFEGPDAVTMHQLLGYEHKLLQVDVAHLVIADDTPVEERERDLWAWGDE